MADRWARQHGKPVEAFPADWRKYGNSAGPILGKHGGILRWGKAAKNDGMRKRTEDVVAS